MQEFHCCRQKIKKKRKKKEDIMENQINNENGKNDQFENNQTFRAKIKKFKT